MDPISLVGLIAAGAQNVMGSAGGFLSSAMQYQQNKKLQDRAFQHQIRMFRNQHQWQVEDLRKAGLNPILSTHSASGASASPTASVSAPDFSNFGNPVDSLVKMQGFSSARDLQKFNRENHEIELAQKEADLAIRELTAENIRSDIALKGSNSALNMLEVNRRSRDWYKRFEDLRDIRNTYKGTTRFGRLVDDFEGQMMRTLMNLNNTEPNSALRISKPALRSNFTKYQYKYHKN